MNKFTAVDKVATDKIAVTIKWLAALKRNFISALG